MATQSIILTAVPKGIIGRPEGTVGRVLVHVAPRLLTPGTVADYTDFIDWPATVLAKRWEVVFPLLGIVAPGTVAGPLPDSLRWTALFPTATPVEGHAFKGYDHRRLYSYPVKGVVDFLRERWGKFGANDPLDAPLYTDLMDDDEGFGPIAFELLGRRPTGQETGPERKARLLSDVRDDLDAASNDPNKWAFPYVDALPATQPAKADAIGRRFLQAEWFHNRGRREEWVTGPPAPTPPAVFEPDFHKIVTLVARYPKLMRLLGLVFELEFPLARTLSSPDTQVQVRLGAGDALALAHQPVSSRTHCKVGGTPIDFDAIYNTPQDPMAGDYLALGDTAAYLVSEVDPDGGAIKALQFADNVSRSRRELAPTSKKTFYTPDRFHLPAHSSAGLMVSRLGRASRQAKVFNRAQLMNAAAFDAVGAPIPGAEPELWAEDLIRGWRFDIKPGPGTKWRSLQGVTGTYHLVNNGAADVAVDFNDPDDREEAILIGGATTRGGANDNEDLYMGENVAQWTGWSLASKLLGLTIGPDDEVMEPDANPTDPDFGIKAALDVAPGSLPPLRFGGEYFVRARSVDLGFQGPRFDPDVDPVEPGAMSPATRYHRYEPVQPPDIVLRDALDGPGDSTRVIVIRSEDANDNAFKETFRHALPPRNSVQLAEHHGFLDSSPGVPDPALYPVIAARDAENLATHPAGVPVDPSDPGGERIFPINHMVLNYLADPLAQQALVRGLPPTGAGTETLLPFRTNAYPDWDTFTIRLLSAASGWNVVGPVLDVALDKAWDIDVRVSCVFDDDHLNNDELGVWPWIQAWVAQHGGPFTVAQLANLIIQGKHWMFTPSRLLRLVHAVRTPLEAPDGTQLGVQRPGVGLTFAHASRLIDIHRRSTGRVDLFGKWSMKIDTGPGGDDPTVPHDFEATAFSIDVDHRSGEPETIDFEGDHEFGDMKHRFVDYQLVATTPFLEFYKESTTVMIPPLPATTATIGQAVEVETVVVRDETVDPPVEFRRGEHYTVDETGLLTLPPGSPIPCPGQVEVSFVAPQIHNTSVVYPMNIASSARPTAPTIEYVVPAFAWAGNGTSTPSLRQGNMLRVYMQRPWWSAGDDEQLAVIVWRGPGLFQVDPPERLKPLVTMFGFDPVFDSDVTARRPSRNSFPLGTPVDGTTVDNAGVGLTLLETGDVVDISAHNVGFDPDRDLWFCDIAVDPGNSKRSYMPFVRLALARDQPHSLPGVHLSRVALADFIQLSPDRAVSVVGSSPTSRTVTLIGRNYTATAFRNQPAVVRVTVELARAGVTDPNLKWATASIRNFNPVTTLTPQLSSGNFVTWTGTVALPNTTAAKRLVIEEIELHREGFEYIANNPNLAGQSQRVVFTDTVLL